MGEVNYSDNKSNYNPDTTQTTQGNDDSKVEVKGVCPIGYLAHGSFSSREDAKENSK